MSIRPRPTLDTLQQILSSFKQFETKLDKLQDDVNFQGQTLNDLRSMVVNISTGTIVNLTSKSEEIKRPIKKYAASQLPSQFDHYEQSVIKTKRKNNIQPMPSKARSFNHADRMDAPYRNNSTPHRSKLVASLSNPVKRKSFRPNKTDTLRRPTIQRTKNLKKPIAKKPNSVV